MKDHKDYNMDTLVIHAGQEPDKEFGAVSPPIYQSSTFAFKSVAEGAARFAGDDDGYIYTRIKNPTSRMLEKNIAALEKGYDAMATATGMAAVSTIYFSLLSSGDHMIGTEALYGPSRMIMENEFSRFNIEHSFIDTSKIENIKQAIKPNTKLLYLETPTNPTIAITDIEAACKLAHEHGITVVVDNTFMSPILQNPLLLGADVVLHSMTKFINGHSDVVGGILVSKDEEIDKKLRKRLINLGGTIDPHQAWLVLRGVKTLSLRVFKAQENAIKVASFLEDHNKINWVKYPGLKSHEQYELAGKQQKGPGSLISFEVKGGLRSGVTLMESLKIPALAVSLGGIESLIQHPASMTHASIPKDKREKAKITDGLVRLSVGCEDIDDILKDFDMALKRI